MSAAVGVRGVGHEVCDFQEYVLACRHRRIVTMVAGMDIEDKSDQDRRAISTGKLNALLHLHTRPINVVVYHGS
jgi:Ser/Thr protein kinase RdoA (MazF antagonist)